jgi:hypothetical protein
VWICGNILKSTLTPYFIARNTQVIVGIKSYIIYSYQCSIISLLASDYENKNKNFFVSGVYGVRAYDAVCAVSLISIES